MDSPENKSPPVCCRQTLMLPVVALAAGPGAALAGILRAGHPSAPVDPPPRHHLRGEKVPKQLRGDRGEPKLKLSCLTFKQLYTPGWWLRMGCVRVKAAVLLVLLYSRCGRVSV